MEGEGTEKKEGSHGFWVGEILDTRYRLMTRAGFGEALLTLGQVLGGLKGWLNCFKLLMVLWQPGAHSAAQDPELQIFRIRLLEIFLAHHTVP